MSNSSIADKSVFMTYSTQRHGWAGARGDMKDEECKKQYISVYSNVVSFFQQTL